MYIKNFELMGISCKNGEITVTVSPTNNIIYASGTSTGYVGSPREYDGKTYIYWKVSGNNIPSWWYSGNHYIQFLKNDGTYTGYQLGTNLGENFIQYLVPKGKYVNVEVKRAGGNVSGNFAFNATSSYNLIYDFKEGGHYANWSQGYFAKSAYIYVDNTSSNWSTVSGYNYMMIGRSGYSNTYALGSISNTKLLYKSNFSFNDYTQIYLLRDNDSEWGESNSQSPGERISYANNHTNQFVYLMDGGDSKNYHLYTPAGPGSSDYPNVAHSAEGSYGDLLHSTQTVNTVVKTSGTYSSANSKAAITLSSYKLNSATTSTASTTTLSTSESTDNITAVKTATTTLTCSNEIATGYQFDGWFANANGGDPLEDDKTYSYATTGTNTVYARFSAKSYTITLNDNGGASGDGTHSVTYDVAVGSLTNTPIKTNYAFCGYQTSSGVKIFNADKTPIPSVEGYTDASGNWIKDGGETLYAIWEDQYGFYGTGGELLGNSWSTPWVPLPNTATNTYSEAYTLVKGTTYTFKIMDRNGGSGSGTWYGNSSGSKNLTIDRSASGVATQLYSGSTENDNIVITPDVTGSYTFSFNSSSHQITITYPASHTITFGAGDINGSSSAITASASPAFSSGEYVLDATSVTFSKGSTNDGYDWKGWYSNSDGTGTLHSSTNGSYTNSSRSANLTVYACYTYHQYDITYKDQGNVAYSGSNEASLPDKHEYNTATVLVNGVKSYYSFGGWYDNEDCTGTAVTTLGATDYTEDVTLYAKWTQTVILDKNGTNNEYVSNGSLTATYNNAGPFAITTAPVRVGYSVEGYYADAGCTHKVMEANGALVNYTGYVEGGKWVHAGATTLYTKWTQDNFVIYRSGDMDGESRTTSDAVYFYAGGTLSKPIEFRMKVHELDTWYSLSLPFAVDAVRVWDPSAKTYYDLTPYYRVGENYYLGHYILRTPSSAAGLSIEGFSSSWVDPSSYYSLPSKNTPYIIMWHNGYFEGKYVSFFGASGQSIPTSMTTGAAPTDDTKLNVYGNDAMCSGSLAGAFTFVNDYGNGAWLRNDDVKTPRTIPAFESYIMASAAATPKFAIFRPGKAFEDSATGWDDVLNSERKAQVVVYTITGLRVTEYNDCSFDEAGRRLSETYNEGIFIMRAGDESVKLMLR